MPRGSPSSSQTTKATLGLRELIFDGEIKPGERVAEVALAARLGVSRTPMRIALAALAHEGLLDALGGGGFIVRAFTYSEVVDAIELRSVLEGTAARFAAERLVSEDGSSRSSRRAPPSTSSSRTCRPTSSCATCR